MRNPLDDGNISAPTGTLAVGLSRREALRREQWERSDNERREKKKNILQEEAESIDSEKKESDTPLGYSERTATAR
jgi:hypothetical protein